MQENVTVSLSAIKNWQMHLILVWTVIVCITVCSRCWTSHTTSTLQSHAQREILGPQHLAVTGGHLTVSLSSGFPAFFAGNRKKKKTNINQDTS
jgi:hypothetical protein